MRSARKLLKMVLAACALAATVVVAGFLVFAAFATRPLETTDVRADGIVVLTGGVHRIQTGAGLLVEKRGRRLLISGVNRVTTRADILKLTGLAEATFNCCVDIGYEATNTVGNATETHRWLRDRGYRSIIVVTSAYHMPRSLAELAREMPEVALHPHPVRAIHREGSRPWWLDGSSVWTLLAEYLKFLPSAGQYLIASYLRSNPAPHDTRPEAEPPADAPPKRASSS